MHGRKQGLGDGLAGRPLLYELGTFSLFGGSDVELWHRWNQHREERLRNPFWCHTNPLLVTKYEFYISKVERKREGFLWDDRYLHIDEILIVLVIFGEIGLN